MAASLLAARLARDPLRQDWSVESAGVWACEGQPASAHAVEEMQERRIDLRAHRARPVTRRIVEGADLVLAMTRHHVEALEAAFPDQAQKVYLISEMVGRAHDIADPYGEPRMAYAATARELAALVASGYERIVTLAGGRASEK
jgi:protein-tyrosine-phosphatase